MRPFAFICILVSFFAKFVDPREGCSFSLGEKFSPLLLDPYNTTLLRPRNGKMVFGYGDQFTIFCPINPDITNKSANNYWQPTLTTSPSHLQEVLVQCGGGEKIIWEGKEHVLEGCHRIMEGAVLNTKKTCGQKKQGTLLKIGYHFKTECFMPIIKVCYILDKYTTLFTLHVMHGEDIRNSPLVPHFFGYKENFAVGAEAAYNIPAQRIMWQKVFGNEVFPNNNYLMDGHLTPYLDFISTPLQYTSKYSVTVVPIWRTIYKGNWRKIEGMIRKVANALRDALIIYSGTHEIFSGSQGNRSTGLFLMDNNLVPVPKFVYKLVYYKQQRKAMVIIVLNNPFHDIKLPGNTQKCSRVCEDSGWASTTFSEQNLGRTYCCPYEYLVENFPNSPSILVTGLLEGPQKVESFDFFRDFDKDRENIGAGTVSSSNKGSTKAGNTTVAG